MSYSLRLPIEHNPLGLGQVSIDSSILKSARLNINIFVSRITTHRSILILTALTSDLQLVSTMTFNMAIIMPIITIIPNHELVFGIARSTSASHQCEDVSFVDHFDDADSCTKLSVYLLGYFMTELKYSEPFLRADSEIRLILVKTDMDYLLFLLIHFLYYCGLRDKYIINIAFCLLLLCY